MKIFISWSGDKSLKVACELRDWLPSVINSVDPFVSSKDIDPGKRWQAEVAGELEASSYGIVCVTRESQSATWLNFEAGALAKAVDAARVVPLAVDLKPSDIKMPLGQFQARAATESGLLEIVLGINASCSEPLPKERIERTFSMCWPTLKSALKAVDLESAFSAGDVPERTDRELLEEIVDSVRAISRASVTYPLLSGGELPENHPLIDELEDLLAGRECEILIRMGARQLGIESRAELDRELKKEVQVRAGIYAVDVYFVPTTHQTEAR